MQAVLLLAAAALASGGPAPSGAGGAGSGAAERAWLGGFCAPVVLGSDEEDGMRRHLATWRARPLPDAQADVERPLDASAPGQLFHLPGEDAPAAFLDRRRGSCSLVFAGAALPQTLVNELASETLPVGERGEASAWGRIRRASSGAPGPRRYFMKVGGRVGFGLCSDVFEDLRLKDGSAATLVMVATCHLLPSETLDHG